MKDAIDVTPDIPGIDTTAKNSEEPADQERKVFLDNRALVELYSGDTVVARFRPPKHVASIVDSLESQDPEAVVSVWLVEDEKTSEPPRDGQSRVKISAFDIERKKVGDAIAILKEAEYTSSEVTTEFQKLCDYATFRSDLVGINATFVYSDCTTGGFSFFSSATKVSGVHMTALYSASKDQLGQYKARMHELHPEVKFPDDNDIGQQLMSAPIGDSDQQVPDGLKKLSQSLGGLPVTVTQ